MKRNHKTFLIELLPKQSVGAEIGVWNGKFTRQVLHRVGPKRYHLIDPWQFMPRYPQRWYGGTRAKNKQDMAAIYREIVKEFGSLPNITIHKLTSVLAARKFSKKYFDWVYVDGDHSYEMVMKDIKLYYPLVKMNGILCGDDWCLSSVSEAVKKFVHAHALEDQLKVQNHQWIITKT